MQSQPALVSLNDIQYARAVIEKQINRTPMHTSRTLGEMLGTTLYFKAELFQKTGSFKLRGALNKLNSLTPEEKAHGVITISAGNHAAAVAYAARASGVAATVVMPEAAVQSKVDATRSYGATVILHGTGKDLLPKMQELQAAGGQTYMPPFNDPMVIAGAGTVGLEIIEDVPQADVVIVPVGGGGLISGVSAAVKQSNPKAKVIGVEPTGADVVSRSLAQNAVAHLDQMNTIADGLAAPFTGEHNLAHIQAFVDQMVLVTDEEIIAAMRLIMERCKLMVEPAGAAGFAALLHDRVAVAPGATVVCILSGGNVDRSRLKAIL
jgi:threonine dehydratase